VVINAAAAAFLGAEDAAAPVEVVGGDDVVAAEPAEEELLLLPQPASTAATARGASGINLVVRTCAPTGSEGLMQQKDERQRTNLPHEAQTFRATV